MPFISLLKRRVGQLMTLSFLLVVFLLIASGCGGESATTTTSAATSVTTTPTDTAATSPTTGAAPSTSGESAQEVPEAIIKLIAFDKKGEKLPQKYTIAYLSEGAGNPYLMARLKGMQDVAAKYGFEFKEFTGNWNPEEQLKAVQDAVAQGFDGYLFAPIAAASGYDLYEEYLKPTGKPVVTLDVPMGTDPDYTPGTAAAVMIQSQHFFDGLVEYAFSRAEGPTKVLSLSGFAGSDLYNMWTRATAKMQEKYPNVEVVVEQPANWDPRVAYQVTQDALNANPDITMVVSHWDDMTRGVVQAIEAAGKVPGQDIKIYSDGAQKDALEKLRAGVIEMTAINTPYEESYYAGVAMVMALVGQPLNAFVYEAQLPSVLEGPGSPWLTKDNVDKWQSKYPDY